MKAHLHQNICAKQLINAFSNESLAGIAHLTVLNAEWLNTFLKIHATLLHRRKKKTTMQRQCSESQPVYTEIKNRIK